MAARFRTLVLACFMMALAAGVTGVSLRSLYQNALAEHRARLMDVVSNQANLLEALGRLGGDHGVSSVPAGVFASTLGETDFGRSGELTVARRQGDMVVFLLRHRRFELECPPPVPLNWDRILPMRRALAGGWGTVTGLDYRGERVLAAYDYVPTLELGVVAQVDLAEIRAPFVRAGAVAGGVALVLVFVGAGLFMRMTNPFIRRLERRVAERTADLARANRELENEVAERRMVEQRLLDHQERLRLLASELAITEERERRQIATELHDRISQTLAVTQMKIDALGAAADATSRQRLVEISALIDQMDEDIRTLTFELSPPVLQLGLGAGVRWLAEQLEAQHGLLVSVVEDDTDMPLDDDIRALMFRTVRELLMNVVKHARANRAEVRLGRDGDQVRVMVADDGVGFDPGRRAAGEDRPAFGLFSVREQLGFVGGSLQVDSAPGTGARVCAVAPLRVPGAVAEEVSP